jgi:hypothetical protein
VLDGGRWFNATPLPLYTPEWSGTRYIGRWVCPRAGPGGCGKYRPLRDSIPVASRALRVAIPTALSPNTKHKTTRWTGVYLWPGALLAELKHYTHTCWWEGVALARCNLEWGGREITLPNTVTLWWVQSYLQPVWTFLETDRQTEPADVFLVLPLLLACLFPLACLAECEPVLAEIKFTHHFSVYKSNTKFI